MPPGRCFLVELTGRARLTTSAWGGGPCPKRGDGLEHRVEVLGDWEARVDDVNFDRAPAISLPVLCACGFELADAVVRSQFCRAYRSEWRRVDTGESMMAAHLFGPGAMYFVPTPFCHHEPKCAQHLTVVTPSGREWDIDSRASNCTLKNDNAHRCWVRHGKPPAITVDKNGLTCRAGAGSIVSGSYHGFLRGGHFTLR